jgi:hypothetical protein
MDPKLIAQARARTISALVAPQRGEVWMLCLQQRANKSFINPEFSGGRSRHCAAFKLANILNRLRATKAQLTLPDRLSNPAIYRRQGIKFAFSSESA